MKIKKNWLQFKEPQAPLTQSASDRSLSGALPDDNTNNHNNIEVLPWLNDEELSDNELSDDKLSDNELSDDKLSDNESDDGSTDEDVSGVSPDDLSDDQMLLKLFDEKKLYISHARIRGPN